MVTLKDADFAALAVDAERYCLGRMSYAVKEYIDIVTPHLDKLPDGILKALCEDFKDCDKTWKRRKLYAEAEAKEGGDPQEIRTFASPWGMEQDERDWRAFWAKCHNELADRNERRQA